jgi:hypothetical protein
MWLQAFNQQERESCAIISNGLKERWVDVIGKEISIQIRVDFDCGPYFAGSRHLVSDIPA